MLYVLWTGVPWRDLPECYGPWSSVYTRYRRWCEAGLFARMLSLLTIGAEGERRHLDCSHIRLHQHGANPPGGQAAQAMGRTKGGLNTKLSAVVDARGRTVGLSLAPGQQHDQHAVIPVLDCAPSPGRGRQWLRCRYLPGGACSPNTPAAASRPNVVGCGRPASTAVMASVPREHASRIHGGRAGPGIVTQIVERGAETAL